MHSDAGEVAFTEDLVEFGGSESALDEDDDLVELESVKEVAQFSILLSLAEFDVVLLETVECKLGLIIDIDLERISHELLANGSDFLR
jgi:hypothetical protein